MGEEKRKRRGERWGGEKNERKGLSSPREVIREKKKKENVERKRFFFGLEI
jgi:hypothetical protein